MCCLQDMNFRKPPMQNLRQNNKSEITTAEVLRNADFRVSAIGLTYVSEAVQHLFFVLIFEICFVVQNVRFLAQFITEAGIIIKRKQVNLDVSCFSIHDDVFASPYDETIFLFISCIDWH